MTGRRCCGCICCFFVVGRHCHGEGHYDETQQPFHFWIKQGNVLTKALSRPDCNHWEFYLQWGKILTVLLPGDIQRKSKWKDNPKPKGKCPKIRFLKNPSMSRCILREGAYLYLSCLEVPKGNFSTGRREGFLSGIFLQGDVGNS